MTRLSPEYSCVILLDNLFYIDKEELMIFDDDGEDIYLDKYFISLIRTLFLSQTEKSPTLYIKEHYFDVVEISSLMINIFTALTTNNLSLFPSDLRKLIERARIGILPYYPEMNNWPRD